VGLTARELQRVQDHVMLLIKNARERVVGFLLEMADRGAGGGACRASDVPQDIADYLGLTIETVSRTLTQLEKTPRSSFRPRAGSCCATALRSVD
jgi:cAMP-binding proteins - catabolite gene activator and regulatory subunit of cAMP-dependent protein kinases